MEPHFIDLLHSELPSPAPADGPAQTVRFAHWREIWQGQRAAKALHISFNTYIRAVVGAYSETVLARVGKGRGKRRRRRNGAA